MSSANRQPPDEVVAYLASVGLYETGPRPSPKKSPNMSGTTATSAKAAVDQTGLIYSRAVEKIAERSKWPSNCIDSTNPHWLTKNPVDVRLALQAMGASPRQDSTNSSKNAVRSSLWSPPHHRLPSSASSVSAVAMLLSRPFAYNATYAYELEGEVQILRDLVKAAEQNAKEKKEEAIIHAGHNNAMREESATKDAKITALQRLLAEVQQNAKTAQEEAAMNAGRANALAEALDDAQDEVACLEKEVNDLKEEEPRDELIQRLTKFWKEHHEDELGFQEELYSIRGAQMKDAREEIACLKKEVNDLKEDRDQMLADNYEENERLALCWETRYNELWEEQNELLLAHDDRTEKVYVRPLKRWFLGALPKRSSNCDEVVEAWMTGNEEAEDDTHDDDDACSDVSSILGLSAIAISEPEETDLKEIGDIDPKIAAIFYGSSNAEEAHAPAELDEAEPALVLPRIEAVASHDEAHPPSSSDRLDNQGWFKARVAKEAAKATANAETGEPIPIKATKAVPAQYFDPSLASHGLEGLDDPFITHEPTVGGAANPPSYSLTIPPARGLVLNMKNNGPVGWVKDYDSLPPTPCPSTKVRANRAPRFVRPSRLNPPTPSTRYSPPHVTIPGIPLPPRRAVKAPGWGSMRPAVSMTAHPFSDPYNPTPPDPFVTAPATPPNPFYWGVEQDEYVERMQMVQRQRQYVANQAAERPHGVMPQMQQQRFVPIQAMEEPRFVPVQAVEGPYGLVPQMEEPVVPIAAVPWGYVPPQDYKAPSGVSNLQRRVRQWW
ncbi:hypothetical protein BU16DRAFT_622213 [Lophium mytilinum]|uniref:Uncharacterized protein n=1 Tax=Lophium mytilinum TaxID=390894 RepID=A0A6A6QF45_9PEZI|nr:hypothetical protein BU16DRAFT_622213 [Lophium mytilinum]